MFPEIQFVCLFMLSCSSIFPLKSLYKPSINSIKVASNYFLLTAGMRRNKTWKLKKKNNWKLKFMIRAQLLWMFLKETKTEINQNDVTIFKSISNTLSWCVWAFHTFFLPGSSCSRDQGWFNSTHRPFLLQACHCRYTVALIGKTLFS